MAANDKNNALSIIRADARTPAVRSEQLDPIKDFFAQHDEIQHDEFTYESTAQESPKEALFGLDLQEYLLFTLNNERYAIELTRIKEIIKITQITNVPHTPHYVAGIISLRGNIVPVYRLSRILNLENEQTEANRTLVVQNASGESIGLIVDKIHHVVRFNKDQIEPPPATVANTGKEFITGIGWEDGKMIIILDLDAVVEEHI